MGTFVSQGIVLVMLLMGLGLCSLCVYVCGGRMGLGLLWGRCVGGGFLVCDGG